jgi:hypothetical protein
MIWGAGASPTATHRPSRKWLPDDRGPIRLNHESDLDLRMGVDLNLSALTLLYPALLYWPNR